MTTINCCRIAIRSYDVCMSVFCQTKTTEFTRTSLSVRFSHASQGVEEKSDSAKQRRTSCSVHRPSTYLQKLATYCKILEIEATNEYKSLFSIVERSNARRLEGALPLLILMVYEAAGGWS